MKWLRYTVLMMAALSANVMAVTVSPVDGQNVNNTGDLTLVYNATCATYCNEAVYYLWQVQVNTDNRTLIDRQEIAPGTPYKIITASVANLPVGAYRYEVTYRYRSPWGWNETNGSQSPVIVVSY